MSVTKWNILGDGGGFDGYVSMVMWGEWVETGYQRLLWIGRQRGGDGEEDPMLSGRIE